MQGLSDSAIFVQVVIAVEKTFYLPDVVYHPNTLLKDDLSIGWFRRLELVILLEEMFDVEFPNDIVAGLLTLDDIVLFLRHWVGPLTPLVQQRHVRYDPAVTRGIAR